MWKIIFWQLIILGLGLFLIFTVREYLQDKVKVEAETARAHCIGEMKVAFPDEERLAPCEDISTYKLKMEYQH